MIILKLDKDRHISLQPTEEKVYLGDNKVSNLSVYLPSKINEFDVSECVIKLRFYVQNEGYIEYDVSTASPYCDIPITTDITYKAQKVGIILVITHDGQVLGNTNMEFLQIYESKNGTELPPRDDLDNIIREQRETIAEQGQTITIQGETITQQGEQITELSGEVTELQGEVAEQAATITRQNTTIDQLNSRVPPLETLEPINPSQQQVTYRPSGDNIGFNPFAVNPPTAEGLGFDYGDLKKDVEFLGGVGTYDPLSGFADFINGGSQILELPYGVTNLNVTNILNAQKLIFPTTINSIKSYAFSNFGTLRTVVLLEPSQLTTIGDFAFQNCSNLGEINLIKGLRTLGAQAFRETNLTDIFLSNSIISIGTNCFYGCAALENVTIENGFNCNSLNLSSSTRYSHDTILSWFNALADRTGLSAYTLTIGATNIAKMTAEEIAIATNKNWNIA